MIDTRHKKIFCDIDGTLVKHDPPSLTAKLDYKMEALEGTIEKLMEWDKKGYNIILTTGRKESLRKTTEEQLSRIGIFYDKLVMGIGGGDRIVVNDNKPDGRQTAFAINLERDKGIKDINL